MLPFLISLLKSVKWQKQYKVGLALGLSLVSAVIIDGIMSGFTLSKIGLNWGIIFATASTFYTAILKGMSVETTLSNTLVK